MRTASPYTPDVEHYQRMIASQDATVELMRGLKNRRRGSPAWKTPIQLAEEISDFALDLRRDFETLLAEARNKHFRYLRDRRSEQNNSDLQSGMSSEITAFELQHEGEPDDRSDHD